MPAFQTVRGMRDLLPEEAEALNCVIAKAREAARLYGYSEVITPIVEPYELLNAKSGEEIRSRMFIFKDLGDRTVALRPEFTALIARLATSTLKNEPKPLRVFSAGSVYRYDEPQLGRYREFWQANFEIMGSSMPDADAEIILLTNNLMRTAGLQNYVFKLGHVGVLRGILTQEHVEERTQNAILQRLDKKDYGEALKLIESERCRDIVRGLLELKSANVSDSAQKTREYVEAYAQAAAAADNLVEILNLVVRSGCKIGSVDPAFARGLEYYTGMIFEVYIPELEIALGGGGRYDRLIEVFGGEPTPAVGAAEGLDRIALAIQTQKVPFSSTHGKRVVVIPVREGLREEALKVAETLREAGISTEFEVMGRKMTKALEDANRRKLNYAIIVGEKELMEGAVVLRDLTKREQNITQITRLAEIIKS